MVRWLVLLLLAGCGDDDGIGLSLLRVRDLVEDEGRTTGEVSVFVSRDCFFSVTVQGALLASGRWQSGERTVTFATGALKRCENDVRVEVAALDGSSQGLDTEVWWCQAEGCPGECSNDPPDADAGPVEEDDAGPVDPYPGFLCDPCTDTVECGDLPNLCVSTGGAQGLCGTECFSSDDCPVGFDCLGFYDDVGNLVTEVCLPWPPQPECP